MAGLLAAVLGGPTLAHGGAACGAELGGGDGLSIWGSRWAREMAAEDGDKGLASGTRCCLFLSGGEAKKRNRVGLSSWTQFLQIITEVFHFLIKMLTRG